MAKIQLPPAERDVLACLHQQGEATAAQLREKLRNYRPMAHGSVATLLRRLEDKGLVAKENGPVGKSFIYRPTRTHQTSFTHLVRDLVQRVFHGDPVSLVASIFETRPPTMEEVKKLQEMLNDLRRQEGGKKGKQP